jgi:hypothetical protein
MLQSSPEPARTSSVLVAAFLMGEPIGPSLLVGIAAVFTGS